MPTPFDTPTPPDSCDSSARMSAAVDDTMPTSTQPPAAGLHRPSAAISQWLQTTLTRLVPVGLAALVLAGCLSRPNLEKELFLLTTKPGTTNAPAAIFEGVFGFEQVSVASPFRERALVYRTAESSYELDPYAEWLVAPEDMIEAAAGAWFRQANLFRDVAEPKSAVRRNLLGELHVTQLYGDFRASAKPAAVLELKFIFSSAEADPGQAVLLSKEYVRAIPIQERTAPALVAGWNEALIGILSEVTTDLSQRVQSTNLKLRAGAK